MKGLQKRSQCDTCPSIKRVIAVTINGVRLSLCEHCRLAYSKIVRERAAEKSRERAAAGEIVTAAAAGEL